MPIPNQYASQAALKDGTPVTVRPIRPEDEPLMVEFHESLSERSVYMRYLRILDLDRRTAHERLARICSIDYDREMVLVAERTNPETGEPEILGVGRLSKNHATPDEAEIALIVSHRFQGQGLGTTLLEKLLEIGRPSRRPPSHLCQHPPQKPRHATPPREARLRPAARQGGRRGQGGLGPPRGRRTTHATTSQGF